MNEAKHSLQKNTNKEKLDRYKKILNNLLNVSINDSCLFHNVDNKRFFDVKTKFGEDFFKSIISSNTFSRSLKENDIIYFVEEIKQTETPAEIIKIFHSYNFEIPEKFEKKLVKETQVKKFEKLKEDIVAEYSLQKQKSSFVWKLILNKARTINEQNNLWPLHLGFLYVTLNVDNKIIQAPLFFKEVNLKINNSSVSLMSIGNIKINEKLIYFLESQGFLFDLDFDYSKFSILKLYDQISKSWSENFEISESLFGNVPNFKSHEIQNKTIKFFPGISLGFFEPTGGHLRKTMVKIIEEDKIDEILDVEFDKNIYKNSVKHVLEKPNFGFYKIQYSNFSQDKAVISALNQNTIIWGPPGTGKSQTISNILTNILMFDKTALVVSQKKAALEVLKQRMEALEIFCLFVLNDKDMNKKSFYKPIQDYIDFLEHLSKGSDPQPITLINENERNYFDKLKELQNHSSWKNNLTYYSRFSALDKYSSKKMLAIKELDDDYQYFLDDIKNEKNINKYLFSKNTLKRKNVFSKYPKEFKKSTKIIKEELLDLSVDLDYFVKHKNDIDIDVLNEISRIAIFDINSVKDKINDPEELKFFIAKQIVKKMKKIPKELKIKYNKFALDARTQSLDIIPFVKKHSEIIKIIFPIIISTPEVDLQAWDEAEFDYALLDESSQIFLEKGIPVLYLAKTKILAGDDQQMQPSRWFASKVEGESEFGDIESILDFAKAKGVYNILLDKNYRSKYASLMSFNSKSFYESKLDVVDVNMSKKESPIEVFNVEGLWENSINRKEIDFAIEKTIENLDKYEKIILLCFNAAQLNEIEKLIFEKYENLEKAILSGQLLLRNIENIQGDEADLVIMTLVYDKTTKLHASYVAKKGGKNALNVAISRARDKMIIVKSIYSNEVNVNNDSEDAYVFKEWLRFLDLNEEDKKNYVSTSNLKQNNKEESALILDKIQNQLKEGVPLFDEIEFKNNFSIGTIQIDLALFDKNSNKFLIGVLIDNFSYCDSYSNYVAFKDKNNFFKIKKYPTLIINQLNLKKESEKIISKINKFYAKNKITKPLI